MQAADAQSRWPHSLREARPLWWPNRRYHLWKHVPTSDLVSAAQLASAQEKWVRFQDVLKTIFPEIADEPGNISSELNRVQTPALSRGPLLVKCDHKIKSTGSIKGRGGVFEVLSFAERLADRHDLKPHSNPKRLISDAARDVFKNYKIVVGSTGNLGFSVGVTGRKLGFQVEVHMSRDAKAWKKNRLRDGGVVVVEHESDYSLAVSAARESANADEFAYFVDDEHSITLLLGYSAAASEIATQLVQFNIEVNENNPLYVYLPCGVGGAPGGITLGLKNIYGPHVHCIFVEPVQSPCLLVQLASGSAEPVSVYDCGLTNETIADGLAVAQASLLVTELVGEQIAGVATVTDDDLNEWVERMWVGEGMRLEPSGAAGFAAYARHGQHVEETYGGNPGTTIVWTTGGAFLPDDEWTKIREDGRKVIAKSLKTLVGPAGLEPATRPL